MKKLILSTIVVTVTTLTIFGQGVKKCDGTILTMTSEKIGKLTPNEIRDFLSAFGKDCRNNVEFSEWSNELLFAIMDSQTALTLKTIERNESKFPNLG